MRASRRGMKEMDIVLGGYASRALAGMDDAELAGFEALLAQPDADLFRWVVAGDAAPAEFAPLIAVLRSGAGAA